MAKHTTNEGKARHATLKWPSEMSCGKIAKRNQLRESQEIFGLKTRRSINSEEPWFECLRAYVPYLARSRRNRACVCVISRARILPTPRESAADFRGRHLAPWPIGFCGLGLGIEGPVVWIFCHILLECALLSKKGIT